MPINRQFPPERPVHQPSLQLNKHQSFPVQEKPVERAPKRNLSKTVARPLKKGTFVDGHEISPDPRQDDFFKMGKSRHRSKSRGRSVIKNQVKQDKKMHRQVRKTRGKEQKDIKMEEEKSRGEEEKNEGVNYAIEYDKDFRPSKMREKSKEKANGPKKNKFEAKKATFNRGMMDQMKEMLRDELSGSEEQEEGNSEEHQEESGNDKESSQIIEGESRVDLVESALTDSDLSEQLSSFTPSERATRF